MARAPTTSDAFNAIGDPQRRQILDLLAGGERPVNDIAEVLRLRQPQASKHLAVLREVGLVQVRQAGKLRLYRLDSAPLKIVYAWVNAYAREWNERFDRLDDYLTALQSSEPAKTS